MVMSALGASRGPVPRRAAHLTGSAPRGTDSDRDSGSEIAPLAGIGRAPRVKLRVEDPGSTTQRCRPRDTLAQLFLEVYMRSILAVPLFVLVAVGFLIATPVGAQVIKETVPGIVNYARVESTVACAGAITTEAVPEIKRLGYKSIINLRLASEPGANIEEATAAAKAAGITYIHIPFNATNPDPAVVDAFLKAIRTPGTEPAFIH